MTLSINPQCLFGMTGTPTQEAPVKIAPQSKRRP
jgi:hypothetical protein